MLNFMFIMSTYDFILLLRTYVSEIGVLFSKI
jgi:hypothetical protein